MTTPNEPGLEKNFVRSRLPWVIAAAAAVVYFLTLNHWISFTNIWNAARISGQSWSPELHGPLYYLVTFPFRWLPPQYVPLALNLFAALCAVLTLALLARSVALLPHDRTEQQRLRERSEFSLLSNRYAWIPPVLAVLLCGLQLTFWERATSGSSEMGQSATFGSDDMFNLLLLAYAIRCLLEYRIGQRDYWLMRAALVWGAGVANCYLLFCLLPAFVICVVWLKGFGFVNPRFLVRMSLCGALGMLLYLLLPLIHVLTAEGAHYNLWQALKQNVALDRSALMFFARIVPKNVLLLLAVTSFLPVLVIGIRWSSSFGDPSRLGSFLASWVFHLAHGALLVACVWVAFDPVFSPRQKGFPFPILSYLGALSVGYFSGYFLLVFQPTGDRFRPSTPLQIWCNRISNTAVWSLLLLVPAGLLWRNLPQILLTNGPAVSQFASRLTEHLPGQGVVMSDDAIRLFLAEGSLARSGQKGKYIFLDTQLLPNPAYHAFQQKRYPDDWVAVVDFNSTERVLDSTLISLMDRLAQKYPICYLHPSFGYYFEKYYAEPHGLSYQLLLYPTNSLSRPPLVQSEIEENEKLWSDCRPSIDRLLSALVPPPPSTNVSLEQRLNRRLRLVRETNATAVVLCKFYSQAINNWGVELQCSSRLKEARTHFQTALALNPRSVTARANARLNKELQAGRPPTLRTPKSLDDELGLYRTWQQAVREDGPSDDPTHRFGQGIVCAQGGLVRQAAQQFERVHELIPDNLLVCMWLARFYVANKLPEPALRLLDGFHVSDDLLQASGVQRVELAQTEATVLFVNDKPLEAEQVLQQAMQNDPSNEDVLGMVAQTSLVFRRYTNTLSALDRHLKLKPDDVGTLVNKGLILSQLEDFTNAIATFTRVLNLETNNYNAMLHRGYACFKSDRLAEARCDYEALRKVFPSSLEVNSGLAEIALRLKDTNSALHYYRLCLSNSNPNLEQSRSINERIKSLQGETP